MHVVAGTVIGRWYVTIFAIVFAWRASRHMGWRKTLLYTAAAVTVGALAENGSVHLGFPYTRYAFDPGLRGDEIWLGDVPLFVPLSYTFMAYFAFASGRLLASGPHHTRAARTWMEVALAWMLAVWALWVLDPISRLGQYFYLGRVFRYAGPGFWFGLPTGSQVGFAATAGVLLAMLFWLMRDEPDQAVARAIDHPHLNALLTYHGQVFHLVIVGFWIGAARDVAVANTIAGAGVLMWVPIATMTAVHWASLRTATRTPPLIPSPAMQARTKA
jgi:putative membrane protein